MIIVRTKIHIDGIKEYKKKLKYKLVSFLFNFISKNDFKFKDFFIQI